MEEAKTLGDNAYKAKNFEEAAKQYTASINAKTESSDKTLLKTLYSNRSAAYSELRRFREAKEDSEECIKIVSGDATKEAKGYARKGKACFGMRNWSESEKAYTRAESLKPGEGYAEEAQRAASAAAAEERARYAQYTQASADGGVMGTLSPKIETLEGLPKTLYGAAEKGMFALYLAYLLPLSWIPFIGSMFPSGLVLWRAFLACAVTINVLHIYCSAGRPRFDQEYLRTVLQYRGVHCTFLAIILFALRPYILAGAPLLLNQLVIRMPVFVKYARPQLAQARETMSSGPMAKYAEQLGNLDALMNSPQGVKTLVDTFANLACTAEVAQGMFLIVELLFPTRNIMLIVLWWQYLMMRYLMDQTSGMKVAFASLDSQLVRVTTHKMCPSIIARAYGWVKAYMISQVESAQAKAEGRDAAAAAGGGGLMDSVKGLASKCSIS